MIAMMLAAALAFALAGAKAEPAATPVEVPSACQPDAATGQVDMQACADAAPEGSMPRALALINLASRAYLAGTIPRRCGCMTPPSLPGRRSVRT